MTEDVVIGPVSSEVELDAALRFVERHLRFGSGRGPAFYAERFREHPELLLAAREGEELVGVLLGSIQGEGVLIGELVVAPEARRRGIGSALLREVELQTRPLGRRELRLGAADEAEEFYLRSGFVPTLFVTLGGDSAGRLREYLGTALPEYKSIIQQDKGFSKAFVQIQEVDKDLERRIERELPGSGAGYLFNKPL